MTAEHTNLDGARVTVERVLPASLEAFVAEHYLRLVRLAGLVCLDRNDAQDAVQNALERAWRHRASLRGEDRMKPWLDAIVVRESIRLNGRARSILRSLTRPLTRADELTVAAPTRLPTGLVDDLRLLSPAQRAILALHFEAGYSLAETAELVNAPLETVRSRLRLVRDRFRREHSEYAEDVP
jgi:RNA polymerase sigma factor (sigma-70 family)